MSTHYDPGPAAGEYSGDDDDQLQPEDTLIDRGVDDVLDEGYSPPEQPYGRSAFGPTSSLDELLAEEEQDPASRLNVWLDEGESVRSDAAEREAEFPEPSEAGGVRGGRLVAPDQGFGEDTEAEMVAEDVGICGGAASAEEAAIHIIEIEE
ncbi:hypothetical protein A5658_09350 [Mycobacterium sp. 1245111.1]|uniref:DUF5709 domain-containing protein n=1 Tax=Mycobacterium sp. 1245111.1 TaxID=1834073 RepID=UPI0007FDFAD0|nr:DUF5709 domain-containing protein [Mycobacterium sp. 1245111.1]OBK35566.1 hypothetical protein A5658_09350 [Mycobacterium sp. 1245111.1]